MPIIHLVAPATTGRLHEHNTTIASNQHTFNYLSPLQNPAETLPGDTKPHVKGHLPSPNPRQPDKFRSDSHGGGFVPVEFAGELEAEWSLVEKRGCEATRGVLGGGVDGDRRTAMGDVRNPNPEVRDLTLEGFGTDLARSWHAFLPEARNRRSEA